MDSNLFRYIWRNSRRDQIALLIVVFVSLPFYFMSLELPKQIVNRAIQGQAFTDGRGAARFLELGVTLPAWLGGARLAIFDGILLERLPYLVAMACLFLLLVLVNGGFKYKINVAQGALAERMARRLRFDLFSLLLRTRPEVIRATKPAEAASLIKDEAEPIGNFTGEAFIQPAFLAGQALTALLFIMTQNLILGGMSAAIVLVQAVIIPRLRREQLRLGRLRQAESRKLAGRVGEVVEIMPAVRAHSTQRFESADIGGRLGTLFDIRFRLFKRKFGVKFLNNLLSQVTPFLFYLIGGYLALTGGLDIGQLVAVIAAYRDLPPPIKELIDWDQQRVDATQKYEQLLEQLSPGLLAAVSAPAVPQADLAAGTLEIARLSHQGPRGEALLDPMSLSLKLPIHAALIGGEQSGAGSLARILGRDVSQFSGRVSLAGADIAALPGAAAGQHIGFAGADPVLFSGTIRENVEYSLKRELVRLEPALAGGADVVARRRESARSGNPLESPDDGWIDYAAAGAGNADELDDRILEALAMAGLDEELYQLGLAGRLDAAENAGLAQRIAAARPEIRQALEIRGLAHLVEPFEAGRFNEHATVAENILFGNPAGPQFTVAALAAEPFTRSVLDQAGLTAPLTAMGLSVARSMLEMFSGLAEGHPLFERYSLFEAEDLPAYEQLAGARSDAIEGEDQQRLIGLALAYMEPRHRLGLLTPALREMTIAARALFQARLPDDLKPLVDFHDSAKVSASAPLRDNLLFGRVAYDIAAAENEVLAAIRNVLETTGLMREIKRQALEFQVGPSGRSLTLAQRAKVHLARCLVKRPGILIIQDSLAMLDAPERAAILARIRAAFAGSTVVVTLSTPEEAAAFPAWLTFNGPRFTALENAEGPSQPAAIDAAEASADDGDTIDAEIRVLMQVPMFSGMDPARLKLMAFASERLTFAPGAAIFTKGAPSDSALVILDGEASVMLETGEGGSVSVATLGRNALAGEMGVVTGAPRSATVIARTQVEALKISKELFFDLVREFPAMAIAVMRELGGRLDRMNERLTARIADELLGSDRK